MDRSGCVCRIGFAGRRFGPVKRMTRLSREGGSGIRALSDPTKTDFPCSRYWNVNEEDSAGMRKLLALGEYTIPVGKRGEDIALQPRANLTATLRLPSRLLWNPLTPAGSSALPLCLVCPDQTGVCMVSVKTVAKASPL